MSSPCPQPHNSWCNERYHSHSCSWDYHSNVGIWSDSHQQPCHGQFSRHYSGRAHYCHQDPVIWSADCILRAPSKGLWHQHPSQDPSSQQCLLGNSRWDVGSIIPITPGKSLLMLLDLLDANACCFLGNQPFHMLCWRAIWPYHHHLPAQWAHQAHSMESILILCIRLGPCPSHMTNYCQCQCTATTVFLWRHPNSLACHSCLWGAPKYMGG